MEPEHARQFIPEAARLSSRAAFALIERPLAEQARNRNHDSSDECEQARKQHKVSQEHTHKALPLTSPVPC